MKEIKLSFEVRIALKQADVHWVEEELLRGGGFWREVLLGVYETWGFEGKEGLFHCGWGQLDSNVKGQ